MQKLASVSPSLARKNFYQEIMKAGDFEAEALRIFYVNFSSKGLFWRVFAGCSGMSRRKE